MLTAIGAEVEIDPTPVEVANPIRFDRDTVHASYDKDAVHRFWRVLIIADTLFKRFSTNFYGKISPVHFFWGSFDLAVTRFNGSKAPPRRGADSYPGRGLLSRGNQRGFLAWKWRLRAAGCLLLVCGAHTGWTQQDCSAR